MWRLIVFSLFVMITLAQTYVVSACGGGASLMIDELADTDVIVHATVLDVDDRGYNAILRVDKYFKGTGSAFLTVMRWPASLEVTSDLRGYSTSCLYDGGGINWVAGREGYFGLHNNGNGTFTDSAKLTSNELHFYETQGRVAFYHGVNNKVEETSLATEEFEDYLLEISHRKTPFEPNFETSRYPFMRFLTITTKNGTQYQLNPDRSVILLDTQDAPIAISNDGSHIAFRVDDEDVGFQYFALTQKSEERSDSGWLTRKPGKAVLFSPNSNFVAVWDESKLTIYMFHNYEDGGYGQRMSLMTIAATPLRWSESNALPAVAWSADSTTLAYEDQDGIWLWDLYELSFPSLILEDADVPLLDLSTTGRYVRFGSQAEWTLHDTRTDQTYDNAIATPDESNLIFIKSEYPEGTPDINRKDKDARDCQAPLAVTCPIYIRQSAIRDWFWYRNDTIAILSCLLYENENTCYLAAHPWHLAIHYVYGGQLLEAPLPFVNALAYDNQYDQPVVATEGYRLEFGFYPLWDRDELGEILRGGDVFDLSDQLDSPIVDLEWGQPIFYEDSLP